MDTIFMKSKNSTACNPYRVLLNLSDKINLKGVIYVLLYQILISTIHEKILKSQTNTINLKYQRQRGMINLNYLMDHFLYQIFKRILSILLKDEKH